MRSAKYIFSVLAVLLVIKLALTDFKCVAYNKKINGGYFITALDERSQMAICCADNVEVVPETVFAVAQNAHFIIAKQHPSGVRTTTNFYIIPLDQRISQSPCENVIGPLTEVEYLREIKELGVGRFEFDVVFHDL
jgi:hypothetical protein